MQNYTNRVKIQVQFAKEYRCQTPVLARIIPIWENLLLWQSTIFYKANTYNPVLCRYLYLFFSAVKKQARTS